MTRPDICVLKVDGTNCDQETAFALEQAGGSPEIVHVNQLRYGEKKLKHYAGLLLPGGFSYGDDIRSGQVQATELISYLADDLQAFQDDQKPIVGICNGFQTLVRAGLLPDGTLGDRQVTLTDNDSGHFECRWIELTVEDNASKIVSPEDFESITIPMQVAHAEGKLFGDFETIQALTNNRQVVFRYSNRDGSRPATYPNNPNGSLGDIAGITDPSGLILGMMPHPERSISAFHEDRELTSIAHQAGEIIFKNIIRYARAS